MSKNPYVEKFSKAFNYGLALVVFLVLVVLAFFPLQTGAATSGDLPVVCLSAQEFAAEYQSGVFEIVNKSSVVIFVDENPYKVDKLITQGQESGDTIEGTWLIENTGKICLLFMENLGKIQKL